jgi:predicted ATPase/class 3 adenylate cyclase
MNVINKQTDSDLLASSFIPAMVKREYVSNSAFISKNFVKRSRAVLLWIDICSFSSLSNSLMNDTVNGVEQITNVLNIHYNAVLREIDTYGGEPLFFAGDGLMSAWSGDDGKMEEFVQLAASCARSILNDRQELNEQKKSFSLHVVIASGMLDVAVLEGVRGNRLATFFGDVFNEVKIASKNRAPGEILISDNTLVFLGPEAKSKPVEFNTSVLLSSPVRFPSSNKGDIELSKNAFNKLQSFIPHTLTFPLSMERLKWIAEIRPVSCLFLKLVNKSADSAGNFQQLKDAVALVTPLVKKYDGLINQVWIDEKDSQMLICFGPPPSAHVDNQERSVRLGLEIFNILMQSGFENSVGISSGMAYCGILGNDMLRHYTVIGDVVNLSSRLAGVKKNALVCDEATYKATSNLVTYQGPITQRIKGRKEDIQIYMPESFLSDSQTVKSPVVPSRHLQLSEMMDGFVGTSDAAGLCIILEAESGMGKTRLLESFKTQIKDKATVLATSGEFIIRNTPYGIAGPIFLQLLNMPEQGDSRSAKEIIDHIKLKYGSLACLLNAVIPVNLPESDAVKSMTSSQRVAKTHELLLGILGEESKQSQLVIIIDDAQWMDVTTTKLLESVNSQLQQCLIVLAFQQNSATPQLREFGFENIKRIVLGELSEAELRQLVCSKLGVSEVSEEVFSLIKETGKGNPFFCIELAGSLLDQKLLRFENDSCFLQKNALRNKFVLPETLRGAVFSRIDRLDQGSQIALKVGSIVGKRFGKKLVKNIYPIETEKNAVFNYLKTARQSGFIDELLVDNMQGYYFTNETIAQVAYEMTLLEQRRKLHKECALWYEENFKSNLTPYYVRLSHHWLQTGDSIKAAKYLEQESTRLFSLGFAQQALDVGLEGIALLNMEIEREPAQIGDKIAENFAFISDFMANRTIESLKNHKVLEDENTKLIISTLLELCPIAHQCQQVSLFVLMTTLSIRLTLEHGNGESAAEAYSMYSIIYKTVTNDSVTALAWSNLAIEVDQINNYKLRGRVIFMHCWFIALWSIPQKTLIPIAEQGAQTAFKRGDLIYGCFNLSLVVVLKSTSGVTLDEVVSNAQRNFIQNNQRVINAAFHLKHEEQVAKAFQGRTISYTSLTDEKYNEEKDIASICDTDLYNQIGYYLVSKLKLNVHFGNYAEALAWGDRAILLLPSFASQPGHIELEQYYAIAAMYHSVEQDGTVNTEVMGKAIAGLANFNAWATVCPENFGHKAMLLQAIYQGLTGDQKNASELFESAAEKALAAGYIQDAGLAYEHLALMQRGSGLNFEESFHSAIKAYSKWGAGGKISYLRQTFGIA